MKITWIQWSPSHILHESGYMKGTGLFSWQQRIKLFNHFAKYKIVPFIPLPPLIGNLLVYVELPPRHEKYEQAAHNTPSVGTPKGLSFLNFFLQGSVSPMLFIVVRSLFHLE